MKRRSIPSSAEARGGAPSSRQGCFTAKTTKGRETGNRVTTTFLQSGPVDTHDSSFNPRNVSSQLRAIYTPINSGDLRVGCADQPDSDSLLNGKSHSGRCRDIRRILMIRLDTVTAHRTRPTINNEKIFGIEPVAVRTRLSGRLQRERLSTSSAAKDGTIICSQFTETPDCQSRCNLLSAKGGRY